MTRSPLADAFGHSTWATLRVIDACLQLSPGQPMSIRLAQALHHGTDHRSQIATALTSLGIAPPEIDVWDFGRVDGRVFETEPRE